MRTRVSPFALSNPNPFSFHRPNLTLSPSFPLPSPTFPGIAADRSAPFGPGMVWCVCGMCVCVCVCVCV